MPKILTVLISLLLFTGCTESPEDRLLKAVQEYSMNGVSIQKAIKAKISELETMGATVKHHWQYKKINKEYFKLVVTIEVVPIAKKARNKKIQYVWKLVKNVSRSQAKEGTVWTLSAHNRTARRFVRQQYNRRFASMGRAGKSEKRGRHRK